MFAEDSSSFVEGDSEQPTFEGWQADGMSRLNCLYKSSLIGIFYELWLSEQSEEEQFECFLELQAGDFNFGAGVWSIRWW